MYEKRVTIRFYEELNDFLPKKWQKVSFNMTVKGKVSVKDLIESLGVPHVEVDLILINGESVSFNAIIGNEDRIAVYPVFELLNVSKLQHLRPTPLRDTRFIVDVNLGKLARALRMYGFDTLYRNNLEDDEIVELSLKEHRIILTRDLGILKTGQVTHGYFVRATNPKVQIKEVIDYFDLTDSGKPFSRCIECNDQLQSVNKNEIEEQLPEKVRESFTDFMKCPSCERIYWKGSHYDSMMVKIQNRHV